MTIREIDDEIERLRNEKYKLEHEAIAEFRPYAQTNVGRCFSVNNTLVKVIDIPEDDSYNRNYFYNKYQYWGLYLNADINGTRESIIPFYEDNVFSGIWGEGNLPSHIKCEEITKEEFNKEFIKRLDEFRERILTI